MTDSSDLQDFRATVRDWCRSHVPADWRKTQSGASDDEFVRFQKEWFQELRRAGYAVPHWPEEWGGGMSTAKQIVLYQELAAHDAPRLVLAFVSIHHAASTLLAAGNDQQRRQHLPAILDGEIWVQGFSEPEAGSDLASLKTAARREADGYVINGQKLWSSGATHSDWCLLLARTDPSAPKRHGISYFLMDMRSPGIDVRPIRNANGESHFCEMFLKDVVIPAGNLIGPENAGWRVAQETLSAERGLTMLELAERLSNAGFKRLVDSCRQPGAGGFRPIDDSLVRDRLAAFETEISGLRALCHGLVERHSAGTDGPAEASVVKLYYSELLQRMMDFGTDMAGLPAHTELEKPFSSSWESGAWLLDFIGSWEWTIPGGTSEIQRTIIGENAGSVCLENQGDRMTMDFAVIHDELRSVARGILAKLDPRAAGGQTPGAVDWQLLADSGWLGLEVPEAADGAGATFAEVAVILHEMGRSAILSSYLGSTVLGVGTLNLVEPGQARDDLLRHLASGSQKATLVAPTADEATALEDAAPSSMGVFRLEPRGGGLRLHGEARFVPDAMEADTLLVVAGHPHSGLVVVPLDRETANLHARQQRVLDATRRFGAVTADGVEVSEESVWPFDDDAGTSFRKLLDRGAVATACDSLGLAETMMEATVAYAGLRKQFDRPIGSFQAVKHACADMLVQVMICRELLSEAVGAVAADAPEAPVAVSMAKSYVCAAAVDVVGKAMQLHGGFGYTWESGIHVFLKRAVLNRSLFGSPSAHRRRLARRYD